MLTVLLKLGDQITLLIFYMKVEGVLFKQIYLGRMEIIGYAF